jgi:cell division protein FtsB
MPSIQRKRLMTRLAESPFTYIVLIIFGALFTYSAVGAYSKSRLAREKMQAAEAEQVKLTDQKQKLTTELANANTDYGLEKALREKFNVVKEGERIIMLVDEEQVASSAEAVGDKKGFFDFIVEIFRK